MTAPVAPGPSRGRVEADPVAPAGPNGGAQGRCGWLSELLTRASRDDANDGDDRAAFAPPRQDERPPRPDDRNPRHAIESLDSLSVDIARMIDDAATELWERYNRGHSPMHKR